MKLRKSFVSNSSSTSFCIVGLSGDDANKKLGNDWQSVFENSEETNLSFHCQEDYGFIGVNIDDMKDDETLGAFKERAAKKLSEFFKKDVKMKDVGLLVDGWYNG